MNLRILFNVKNQTNKDQEYAMGEFTATKTLSLAATKYKTVDDITEQHSKSFAKQETLKQVQWKECTKQIGQSQRIK